MKTLVALCAGLFLAGSAAACAGERSWRLDDVERNGERCDDLVVESGDDGRVVVDAVSFRVPDGYRPYSCDDEHPWIVVGYRDEHGEETHTLALMVGVQQLNPAGASQITADNRLQVLKAFAEDCIEADRNWERCRDLEAGPNDLAIAGLDCAGWDEALLDIGVPDAPEGEAWPMRSRTIACFDPGLPPTTLIMLSWSERHPPGVEGMPEDEVMARSEEFLLSVVFEGE